MKIEYRCIVTFLLFIDQKLLELHPTDNSAVNGQYSFDTLNPCLVELVVSRGKGFSRRNSISILSPPT